MPEVLYSIYSLLKAQEKVFFFCILYTHTSIFFPLYSAKTDVVKSLGSLPLWLTDMTALGKRLKGVFIWKKKEK